MTDSESDPFAVVVDNIDPLLRPRQVLAIGEWHGTEEFPALIARLVDAAVARDLTVIVGLEVPCSEIPGQIGPFWTRRPEFQDRRSSRATARLVDELVALLARASGGQAWMITGEAGEGGGPKPIPDDADVPPGASWAGRPGPDGHHGYVHLGRLTASPPTGWPLVEPKVRVSDGP